MSETVTPLFDALPHLTGHGLDFTRANRLTLEAIDRYNEPWRRHHNIPHLNDVVGFLMDHLEVLEKPRRTLWAGVDHDIVYVPWVAAPGVNEELSAQLNRQRLAPFLPTEEVASMGSFIRKTADHEWDGADNDLAYLLDADLKILGAPEEEFDQYDNNIWEEFKDFVPKDVYDAGRKGILQGFYDQDRLFITDIAYKLYEDQAKANLERRLSQF